jgi:hypothetical protein
VNSPLPSEPGVWWHTRMARWPSRPPSEWRKSSVFLVPPKCPILPELAGIAMVRSVLALHRQDASTDRIVSRLRIAELPDMLLDSATRHYSSRNRLSLWLAVASSIGSATVVIGNPQLERPEDVEVCGRLLQEASAVHSVILIAGAPRDLTAAAEAKPWPPPEGASS